MQRLNACLDRLVREQRRTVAATLDESHSRHHGVSGKRLQREYQWLLDQAVDDQSMFCRIDVRIARMRNHEVQWIRRECAVDQMMRRPRMLSA